MKIEWPTKRFKTVKFSKLKALDCFQYEIDGEIYIKLSGNNITSNVANLVYGHLATTTPNCEVIKLDCKLVVLGDAK